VQNTISPWNFYKGWDIYQSHLVRAIEPLTTEQLELRISPNLRSIGLLAKHIVRTRANWLALAIGEGGLDKDVAAIAQWKHDGDVPSTAELVRGLEVTFRAWQECLERWTLEGLEYIFRGEWGGEPYELSRQWIIWHVLEHDLHHGGELSFSLGAHGLAAPDL
jgi:uncharacterized damage-inducible protein DinB